MSEGPADWPHSKGLAQDTTLDHDSAHRDSISLLGSKSPGVVRIEQIASTMTRTNKVVLFLGVLLIAYVYGLDINTRYTYTVISSPTPTRLPPH